MAEKNVDYKKNSSQWNYHPDLPLENYSLFSRSFGLRYVVSWFFRNWLHLGEKLLLVIIAALAWVFLYPPLEDFADAMYWNSKGDSSKLTAYYTACEKVKTDNPKPS